MMTGLTRFDFSTKKLTRSKLYLLVLSVLLLVQLARVLGNSCRLFVFTIEGSADGLLPSHWWTSIDLRSVFWLIVAPLLALIVVRREKPWWSRLGAHVALLSTGLLISGVVVHQAAYRQAVEREQIRQASTAEPRPQDREGQGLSIWTNPGRVRLLQPHGSPMRLSEYGLRFWIREIVVGVTDYALLALVGYTVMYFRLSELRSQQATRLRGLLVESRHDALCARLTHHFLFNTLNSISALTLTNGNAARACIGQLGELLRASIDSLPKGEVLLEEELHTLEIYLSLQRTRFGERLDYTIDIEPGLDRALVPAFLLQPLVENSFEHGFAEHVGCARVWIVARRLGDFCRLEVLDNGADMNAVTSLDERYGLGVTRDRLKLQYNGAANIQIAPNLPSGLRVTINIPYRTEPPTSELNN